MQMIWKIKSKTIRRVALIAALPYAAGLLGLAFFCELFIRSFAVVGEISRELMDATVETSAEWLNCWDHEGKE